MLKPDIHFDYFGLPIYNIMAIVGGLTAFVLLRKRERQLNVRPSLAGKLHSVIVVSFAFSLLTANAANWVMFPAVLSYPLLRRFASAGFTFYYGMFGFFCAFAALTKAQRLNWRFWLNEIVPYVILFHGFGRIGCSLAGCCYGRDISPAITLAGLRVDMFPAREIEALCLFVMFFIFRYAIKNFRFPLYVVFYAVARFALEFGRGDNRGVLLTAALSPAQVTAVLSLLCVGAWWCRRMVIKGIILRCGGKRT